MALFVQTAAMNLLHGSLVEIKVFKVSTSQYL